MRLLRPRRPEPALAPFEPAFAPEPSAALAPSPAGARQRESDMSTQRPPEPGLWPFALGALTACPLIVMAAALGSDSLSLPLFSWLCAAEGLCAAGLWRAAFRSPRSLGAP